MTPFERGEKGVEQIYSQNEENKEREGGGVEIVRKMMAKVEEVREKNGRMPSVVIEDVNMLYTLLDSSSSSSSAASPNRLTPPAASLLCTFIGYLHHLISSTSSSPSSSSTVAASSTSSSSSPSLFVAPSLVLCVHHDVPSDYSWLSFLCTLSDLRVTFSPLRSGRSRDVDGVMAIQRVEGGGRGKTDSGSGVDGLTMQLHYKLSEIGVKVFVRGEGAK